MAVLAPAEELPSACGECDGEGGVGEPPHEEKDEGGGGALARDDVGEVNAVVQPQVWVEALPVVVDQAAEAEASPSWVLRP